MKDELLKFKKDIKGPYLYIFISGLIIFSIFILAFVLYFVFNYEIIPFNEFEGTIFVIMSPFYMIGSFFIILISYLGYRNFGKKLDYESFYDLRYKFTISLVLLGFFQYSFFGKYIVLLIVLYIIDIVILYDMFFSENVRAINYFQDIENNKDKK